MNIVTLDFESYWATDYSLTKLSPLEYVMGDRFELQSCSWKLDDGATYCVFGQDKITEALGQFNWKTHAACAHNMSGFDAYIMAYRLNIRPALWVCTQAMARPLYAKTVGLSLAKLVQHYNLGVKDNTVLIQTKGKRLEDFTPEELKQMAVYNRTDTDQCRGLFKHLRLHYTPAEMWQIDAVTRMRTEPQFKLNTTLLETAASVERTRKHAAVLQMARLLGIPADCADPAEEARGMLASAPKFVEILQSQGVEVPVKTSPTNPEKKIPALSKTDEEFLALQDHPNEIIAAAARTRLDVKSTLLETRIQKFLTAGRLTGGTLPVPIRYCGADTTGRDSGEEYNCQNLPAIRGAPKVSDALRNSMEAPKGYKVIVADQSGIELRVNHFLWRVPSSMALYQASPDKADLYKAFASESLFMVPEAEVSKTQRQVAKVAQLGLGFGAGATTFQRIAKTMGGIDLPLEERYDGELCAKGVVDTWRRAYANIVTGWAACGEAILDITRGTVADVDPWGLVKTCPEGLRLPSGRLIRYPDLRQEDDGEWPDGRRKKSWFYAHGRHKARLTGPKMDENIVQALARDSVFDCALDFFKLARLRPALRVHDELVYVVPTKEADELLAVLQGVMRTPPQWWPALVVWSEGDSAQSYGAAK